MSKPRIFISHCNSSIEPTIYAMNIIYLIGCIPVIAEHLPKSSTPVRTLVYGNLDNCDACVVIATPDRNGDNGKEPSQGVVTEIGHLQDHSKLKDKYFIIKEKNVYLGPMIPETHYTFTLSDYSPIAEAILIELGSMGFFRNYYELPGSDLRMHELMETLSQLRELGRNGILDTAVFKNSMRQQLEKFVNKIIFGDN